MGISKRHLERQQDLYDTGLQLCIEVGAIAECEHHPGSYYDGGGEVEDAYKLAASRVARGEIETSGNEGQQTVTDAIKAAYQDNFVADGCMSCDNIFNKD